MELKEYITKLDHFGRQLLDPFKKKEYAGMALCSYKFAAAINRNEMEIEPFLAYFSCAT